MGTFTKKQLFKTVRVVEIEGKLDEIDSNVKTLPILEGLVKAGIAVDMGFKLQFISPNCPVCGYSVQRATITNVRDAVMEIRLFCPYCHWTEEMPK